MITSDRREERTVGSASYDPRLFVGMLLGLIVMLASSGADA
jgi:hypothetical protein